MKSLHWGTRALICSVPVSIFWIGTLTADYLNMMDVGIAVVMTAISIFWVTRPFIAEP